MAIAVSILVTIFLTYIIGFYFIKNARNFKMVDIPNNRSSHKVETARGFGIVIFISAYSSIFILNNIIFNENLLLFFSIALVTLLGLYDDLNGSSPFGKIFILLIACFLLYYSGYIISDLGSFFNSELKLNTIYAILFTFFAVIAFTNALNLIDGLDGLSGMTSIVILLSFLLIGIINEDPLLTIVPAIFISSIIVFLIFNWHPAKVFLGDTGSLMIGFIISVLAIKSLDYIEPISILYISALPIIDSLFVFSRRAIRGVSPFTSDKGHLHHILLNYYNGKVVATVITLGIVQVVYSIVGIFIVANVSDSFPPLLVFIVLIILLYKIISKLDLFQE